MFVDGNQSVVLINSKPCSPSVQQSHTLSVFPGADFVASMSIEIDSSVVGGKPSDFAGLVTHFAADAINESNGSSITVWSDSSGYGRNLDNSRGDPKILSSSLLDGRMVVAFNGFSQLYSSEDYGALLGEYTILTLARHAGSLDQSVISSVGSNWVFGLGNNYSSYWKLGSGHEFMGSASDDSWHLYAGTLSSSGTIELIRDGYQVEQANISLNEDSKPRLLAFGGSQANSSFSQSEIAEFILFDRVLSPTEISSLSNYLRTKWLGGRLLNFPLLLRLSQASHPDFDSSSFADSVSAGDLRIVDEAYRPLSFEIEEWNSTGESLVWVKVDELTETTQIKAFWGNEHNTTLPTPTDWSSFEGVWHLSDNSDSSSNARTLSPTTIQHGNGIVGSAAYFDGTSSYESSTYAGISGSQSRSVSFWVRSSQLNAFPLGWGEGGGRWDVGWNAGGLVVEVNATNRSQRLGLLSDDNWHHLLFSYSSGDSLEKVEIYLDGKQMQVPSLGDNSQVNTITSFIPVNIGASSHGSVMNGWLDEVRISGMPRGQAWASYSYENQRLNGTLLDFDLIYSSPPVLPSDLNLTIVMGTPFEYQFRSDPPATQYISVNSSLPGGLSFNESTGILSGTPDSTGSFFLEINATNAKGYSLSTLNINSINTPFSPQVALGPVLEISGRSARLVEIW